LSAGIQLYELLQGEIFGKTILIFHESPD
jgi:hypothetical protein